MENILVIDIGNTNIVCGLYCEGVLFRSWRIHSDQEKTTDEYFVILSNLSDHIQLSYIALASVVPAIGQTIERVITKYLKVPYVFVTGRTDLGMNFPVEDPSLIGADLIVNGYMAWQKYQTNCIVCDLGTATTIQLISKEGEFLGTVIMPGMITGASNLFDKAALLTRIQIEDSPTLLGLNTKDSLLAGIIRGHAFSIDGFIRSIKEQYNELGDFTTIATGGFSNLIKRHSSLVDIADNTLILEGLYNIAKKYW